MEFWLQSHSCPNWDFKKPAFWTAECTWGSMIIHLPAKNPYLKPFAAYKASLSTRYFGQQNYSAKKAEWEPGFEKVLNLLENPINSSGHLKILGYFGQE